MCVLDYKISSLSVTTYHRFNSLYLFALTAYLSSCWRKAWPAPYNLIFATVEVAVTFAQTNNTCELIFVFSAYTCLHPYSWFVFLRLTINSNAAILVLFSYLCRYSSHAQICSIGLVESGAVQFHNSFEWSWYTFYPMFLSSYHTYSFGRSVVTSRRICRISVIVQDKFS
jgi:hypothetical protein